MITQPSAKINDTAKGPLAGYLFQFEKALLALAELKDPDAYISIEEVDDLSTHEPDGTVLLTAQAKHSISNSGSTFGNTSTALWRTMEIWIAKLKKGIFTDQTEFVCATNKVIEANALVRKLATQPFETTFQEIKRLLSDEKEKLRKVLKENPEGGKSLKEIIRLITKVVKQKDQLEVIAGQLKIEDNENTKVKFLNELHLSAEQVTPLQRDNIYDTFYGWITNNSKARWLNGKEAQFTKKSFDEKWFLIRSNPTIVGAVFRTKETLGDPSEKEIFDKKKELFVRQIEDIKRNQKAKLRIIREAIINFIYTDIEIARVVEKGDYTEKDFDEFLKQCRNTWQETVDTKVHKEFDDYNEEEKNDLAISIFDAIMHDIKMEFKDGFCFTTANQYVKNGCFLRLSNEPTIGWHPEWELKYKIDEKS